MRQPLRFSTRVLLIPLAFLVSACGSEDPDAGDPGATATAPVSDSASASGPEEASPAPEGEDSGDFAAEDNGTGKVTVGGIEYPNFAGDCFIHRGLDPETYLPVEVGDLSMEDLTVIVGVDNVASEPETEANFIIATATAFRMGGLGITGTVDSIDYVGPRAMVGSLDLALVEFSGTSEDGVPVVAELVCEIGLG